MAEAGVVPFQPWNAEGYADVTPLPPAPGSPSVIPLKIYPPGEETVTQKDFPAGLVVIPDNMSLADTNPATLPLEITDGKRMKVKIGDSVNNPNGVVVLFTARK